MRKLMGAAALFGVVICAALLGEPPGDSMARPQGVAAARREIQKGLHGGKRVVLVVAEKDSAKADGEAYADWAENLNRFAASVSEDVTMIELTPLVYGRLVVEPQLKQRYAALFVRDLNHALVHDGTIVEQSVYKLGASYLKSNGGKAYELAHHQDLADNGLSEKRIRLAASSQ